jgi:exodeoxyribonuclease VII small subunit
MELAHELLDLADLAFGHAVWKLSRHAGASKVTGAERVATGGICHLYCAAVAKSRKRSSAPKVETEPDEASVDAVLGELEEVVADLERGDLPLEESLARFERGVALSRRGEQLLSSVERRVEMLMAERDETVPFESGDTDE